MSLAVYKNSFRVMIMVDGTEQFFLDGAELRKQAHGQDILKELGFLLFLIVNVIEM